MSTNGKKLVGIDTTMRRPKVQPPKELSNQAKKVWKTLVNSCPNEQFTDSDFIVLSVFCENYAIMVKATGMLQEQGEIIEAPSGRTIKNPWFGILQECTGKITALSTKLRLAPNARKKSDETNEKATPFVPVGGKKSGLAALIDGVD